MRTRSRYIFGAALAATASLGFLPNVAKQAQAATVASFTFETLASNFSSTGAAAGPFVADAGVGSASGVHVASTTVYSSPAGNGSARSLSSNGWAVGDYYQFAVPTTGFDSLMVSFDQTGSNTGPGVFKFQYSTDGSTFNDFATYTLWNTASAFGAVENTALTHTFDLSGIAALNGNANAVFRLVDNSTQPFNFPTATNTTVSVASGGTDRVDNFLVVGSVAGGTTPEPSTLALVSVAAAGLLNRKRR